MKILLQLKILIGKIRLWGMRGAVSYVIRLTEQRRLVRNLLANSKKDGNDHIRGITLVGPMRTSSSLSKVMRDFAYALKEAGVPYQTYDNGSASEVPDEDVNGILTSLEDFRVNKYTHVVEMFADPVFEKAGIPTHRIAFWEFDSGFKEARPDMLGSRSVIAMSDFNADYYRQVYASGYAAKVHKILYPFRYDAQVSDSEALQARDRYGIPKNAFMVFYNFDFRSSYGRKNPDALVRAFSQAFKGVGDAVLVFKTMGAKQCAEKLAELMNLIEKCGVMSQTILINSYIPQHDLYALTKASDVYCSLHRGEGLGLGIAEAMCMGKPVIISDWSAPTEFCSDENSFRIPVRIVSVPEDGKDHILYQWVRTWAEPDVACAAKALRRLYEDAGMRERLGKNARNTILEYFSSANFKKSVEDFLSNA